MSNELENIILTIDTREQAKSKLLLDVYQLKVNNKLITVSFEVAEVLNRLGAEVLQTKVPFRRVNCVENWALSHGAIVEHSALKLCDYWLLGEFRGVSVNLGIEAKAMPDIATSYSELSDKLAKAYQLYDDVALFVEAGNYTFTPDADNFHAIIDNPAVRNGDADILPLAVYENMLASFQREGVHVRQLRSEAHFPYAISGLLISITKPIHTGLHIKSKDFTSQYLNVLAKVPHISMARATKLIKNYPNLNWLCGASEESYKQVLGSKVGSELYAFIRCHDLETDEWRNNFHRNGIEKDNPTSELPKNQSPDTDASSPRIKSSRVVDSHYHEQQKDRVVDGIVCSYADPKNRAECKHPDHFKHFKSLSSPAKVVTEADTLIQVPIGRPMNIGNTFTATHDISSHPDSNSTTIIIPKSDDPQRPPINYNHISEEKQEVCHTPPAETSMDLGLDDKQTKYQEVKPNVIDLFKKDKMNLDLTLKDFMKDYKPHLMQEIVDYCEGWGAPYIFDRVLANVKSGNIKKMTEQDGRITYQRTA